ncbi:MAG: SDR family oxidoreductase [Comamonas sp.]|jgi:short-subunit dehydrogenase|nr:SDR family oxidoreductase [Comamonas sp.]
MSQQQIAISSRAPLVYITGASSGIGQALARHYYDLGWSLALVARRTQVLKQWAQDSQLDAQRYAVYQADVTDIDSACAAGEACLDHQGLPALVIANAGISWGVDTSQREDLSAMQQVLASNTMGVAASFQPFIAPMVARGSGSLVGVASIAGIRGLPGHGAYCASKAAVIAYCESLRTELKASGVAVVTLLPGYVDTPLTRSNPYPMPFLLSPQEFARRAYRVIDRKAGYAIIPWQMALIGRVMNLLPAFIWDRVVAGRTRKPRHLSEH